MSEAMAVSEIESADVVHPDSKAPARVAATAIWILVGAGIAAGVFMRAWYLTHRPVSSDEAIAGLMARQILHGHFWTFYWGQSYGGVEPYVVALGFGIFGPSAWVLRAVPLLFSLAAAIVTWRAARYVVRDPLLALLAGVAVWATPDSAVGTSFIEWGFRGVALLCGIGLVLLALRILDRDRRWWIAGAAGLVAGLGWWSSPEMAYFLVPAVLLIGAAWVAAFRAGMRGNLVAGISATAAGAVIGAFPWIWTNVHTRFRSLRSSAFSKPPGTPGFRGRLHIFVHYSVGMLASVRDIFTGSWLGGRALGEGLLALFLLVLAAALVLCLKRRDRSVALAVGVVVFPVLLAMSPATWYWQTGRYTGYVVPLYVLVLAAGAAEAGRWWSSRRSAPKPEMQEPSNVGRVILGVVAAGLLATTLASFVRDPTPGIGLLSKWGDPNGATRRTIQQLDRAGVKEGYANYWVAYRLDLLSRGHLQLTVGRGEFVRWFELDRQVRGNPLAAWIFVKPNRASAIQFGVFGGPAGLTEPALLGDLRMNEISYRIVDTELIQAVVPTRPLPPGIVWPAA